LETYKKDILENICYTELVYGRINKKLNISLPKEEIEKLVYDVIKYTDSANFIKKGKNIYVNNKEKNIQLTINSFTYRIITADILTRK